MSLVDYAIEIAAKLHAGQRRKTAVASHLLPYVVHPLEVMKAVWKWGCGDEATMAAAVLHDVIEDTPTDYEKLAGMTSRLVAGVVQELTLPAGVAKATYLESFKDPKATSVRALVIKVADRICNVTDYTFSDQWYAAKYMTKASVLYEALNERRAEVDEMWGEDARRNAVGAWIHLAEWLGLEGFGK